MKKTYITPALEAVMLDAKTNMCISSLPVKDEEGNSQLSKKFWGTTMFDEEEEEEVTDSWF